MIAGAEKILGAVGDELSAMVGGTFDARAINDTLANIAATDVSLACVAWRQVTNFARLAETDHEEAIASLLRGRIVATALAAARTSAEAVRPGRLRIRGEDLMVTGLAYADHVLVEAGAHEGSTAFLVPACGIVAAHRTTMAGLNGSDNARISIDVIVPAEAMVGAEGGAKAVVETPYDRGLTMGAVAVGAARRASELLGRSANGPAPIIVGRAVAAAAAAEALVAATPGYAPDAAWWSRAAKVAAVEAAARMCDAVATEAGPRAFDAGHPVNELAADVRGLAFQAPSDSATLRALAESCGPPVALEAVRDSRGAVAGP